MNEIQIWLESDTPDYKTGVTLFAKYSNNISLLHYFCRKQAISKLTYELQKLSHSPKKEKKINTPIVLENKPERVTIDTEDKIKVDDLPDILKIEYQKNVNDYKILRGAHADMCAAKTDEDRAELRAKIDALDDAITERWNVIDNFVLYGKLPQKDKKEIINESTVTALTTKEIIANRSYISRCLAAQKKLSNEKHAELQKRVSDMIKDGQKLDEKTIEGLKNLSIIV